MDRREAIKGLGMSLGLVVATPTVISLLQSCKSEPKIDWVPEFFTTEEGQAIKKLVGLILPKTETLPGATDVNVSEFIDKYASQVASTEDREEFRKGLGGLSSATGKPMGKASNEDYDKLLAKYLKATPEQVQAYQENENEKQVFETLMILREISIWGYKTNQKVGMEILPYDPIPGEYIGCISLEEATGGKVWSLS